MHRPQPQLEQSPGWVTVSWRHNAISAFVKSPTCLTSPCHRRGFFEAIVRTDPVRCPSSTMLGDPLDATDQVQPQRAGSSRIYASVSISPGTSVSQLSIILRPFAQKRICDGAPTIVNKVEEA